jgi:RNA polymerase sigma factor (sigma-70 family)
MSESADDIAQESIVVLLSKAEYRAKPESEASWIAFGIVRNLIRAGWRPPKADAFPEGFDPVDTTPRVDETMIVGEQFEQIRAAALKLGKRCQQIIKQRLKGRTSREIGALLGMSDGAVNVHYHRCRKQWRELILEAR